MYSFSSDVVLRNLHSGVDERAAIVTLDARTALKQIDKGWWTLEGVDPADLENQPDVTWRDWARIAGHAKDHATHICVACVTQADKQVQGAMLYRIDGHFESDPTISAVEVFLLATAPRNRDIATYKRKYIGVGSSLLLDAVRHSYSLGWNGRLVLKSKSAQATVRFYVNKGFQSLFKDADDRIVMELSSEAALDWLRAKRMIL